MDELKKPVKQREQCKIERLNIKSRVCIDDEGITHLALAGNQNKKDVVELREEVLRLNKDIPGKMRILVDFTKLEKSLPETRREGAKSIKFLDKEIRKVAMFGGSTFIRLVITFVVRASGRNKKVRYFKVEQEALKWLKQQETNRQILN